MHDKVRTTHPINSKLGSVILLGMLITWLDFGKFCLTLFGACFLFVCLFVLFCFVLLFKFRMSVLRVKYSIGHISGIVVPIDVKYLIGVKRKETKSCRYWADCLALSFDHMHDLDLEASRCTFQSLISWMGRLINMERNGFELIIHDHDCHICVTMIGWVDVPDRDRGDITCRSTCRRHI